MCAAPWPPFLPHNPRLPTREPHPRGLSGIRTILPALASLQAPLQLKGLGAVEAVGQTP